MRSQFKTNNLVAIVIAILLIVVGFTLGFIHNRMESKQTQRATIETPAISDVQAALDIYNLDTGQVSV